MLGILGKKIGMTQIFDENGNVVPVTVVEAGPMTVIQVKTVESDGYNAIQVGFGEVKEKALNKPQKGHFEKAGVEAKRFVQEFRLDDVSEYSVGQVLTADLFEAGVILATQKTDVIAQPFGVFEKSSVRHQGGAGEIVGQGHATE